MIRAALTLLLCAAAARAQITIATPENGATVAGHFRAKGLGQPTAVLVRDLDFDPAGFVSWSVAGNHWQADVTLYPWCPDVFWFVVGNDGSVVIHTLYLGE